MRFVNCRHFTRNLNMIRKVMIAIMAAFLTNAAVAATIDFESQYGGYGYSDYSFIEDGFRVSYSPISPFGFYIVDDPADHLGMCSPACASNGTTAFYSFNESSVTIDLEDKGLFSLTSLDVAKTFLGDGRPLTMTLTAMGVNGVVTNTIYLEENLAESFSNFSFTDFVNISSLTITGGQAFPEFAIDNVIVSKAEIPEPASWAMLIAGLGIICGVRRRRPRSGFAR
ncbi:MAG: PEP-CTERM sorting domain-containing protein [Oxalobacteraceae bacterium]|nr:MAG: PEP-CTERM sorting domain-containing protein [Oxalobacteraceae bacterium]